MGKVLIIATTALIISILGCAKNKPLSFRDKSISYYDIFWRDTVNVDRYRIIKNFNGYELYVYRLDDELDRNESKNITKIIKLKEADWNAFIKIIKDNPNGFWKPNVKSIIEQGLDDRFVRIIGYENGKKKVVRYSRTSSFLAYDLYEYLKEIETKNVSVLPTK